MHKLYQKSEIWFSIAWIILYVVGTSVTDGIHKSVTLGLHVVMSAVLLVWMKRNGLMEKYGLCRSGIPAKKFLYYVPLAVIMSCNLWFGVTMNMPHGETLLYVGSMLCVGFLEEIIFRGLLFRAMEKENLKAAVIVSSVTFGIGHIVNLINGSGADLLSNLCQVCYAIAFGFMCVTLLYRGRSLIPCIVTHSTVNMLSVFLPQQTPGQEIFTAAMLTVIPVVYILYLMKSLPKVAVDKPEKQ